MVGGPVQADRPCYVERSADGELLSSIAEQRFSYVLSSRATGKSSLMARTIRRLRREGQLAAVVDLTQIGARGETADPGRWYYSIAYRIVRDLRIKTDLQYWWQEKSALLGDQRLVEFFWEIVLTHTTAPVTIFIDEAERAIDLSFSSELFSAIRSCYLQRVTEPDYARLNFVVMGVATPARLCPNESISPFYDGRSIELPDFTLTECYQLGAGFGTDATVSRALIERIYAWTNGHPYLTQKIARGVARKGGRPADVERVVQEQFLAPGASQEEPLLNHVRTLLADRAPGSRHALARLAKLSKGLDVQDDPRSEPRELLRLAGVVAADASGKLAFRNQIYARVFDESWAKGQTPVNWRMRGAAAAVLLAALWLPYWYTQILPRPYINTLSVVTQDFAVAEDAYAKLRRLPGFGSRADRLLADVMVRRSERTSTVTEALAADAVIRDLGMEDVADEMMARYWLRQSLAAMHRGDRDVALLYAMEARQDSAAAAAPAAAELIGADYPKLRRAFRLPQAPMSWEVDWETSELVVVDRAHRVERLPLDWSAGPQLARTASARVPGRLNAVQHVPVVRELQVEDEGSARGFNLLLTVQHPRASDLMLTLTAPSGARAVLDVPQPRADQHELIFSVRGNAELAALAEESTLGRWALTLVDRRAGDAGLLTSWGLQFTGGSQTWVDAPEQGIALPDPFRSEQVDVALSAAGRVAVARPTRSGATGALAVWDLREGVLLHDLDVQAAPEQIVISARLDRLLTVSGRTATLWDTMGGTPIARLTAETRFLMQPALSSDEQFVALAEEGDAGMPRIRLVRTETGDVVSEFDGVAAIRDWVLGPEARFLAVLDGAQRAFVLDPREGELLLELRHYEDLVRLLPGAVDGTLVTVDAQGGIHGWRVDAADGGVVSDSWLIATTADAASVSLAASADALAFALTDGLVAVADLHAERRPQYFRAEEGDTPSTALAPRADRLVTADGSILRLWSVEPSPPIGKIDRDLSAVALDSTGEVAAFGYRGGHVRVRRVDELERMQGRLDSVDYIGHRGTVTSLAVNAARNMIASGGADGVVRIWNMTTVAPTSHFLRHPVGSIRALDLSAAGDHVVSAGEYSARLWHTQTGELLGEIPVDRAARAVALSQSGELVAVGDTAGNIFFGPARGAQALLSARAHDAVTALAFSANGELLLSGDEAGNLQLWETDAADSNRATYLFADPVTWVAFRPDGQRILARSGAWVHELAVRTGGLAVVATRLLPIHVGPHAVPALVDADRLRVLAGPEVGEPAYADLALSLAEVEPLPPDSPLLARDWPAVLGLSLDRRTGAVRIAR